MKGKKLDLIVLIFLLLIGVIYSVLTKDMYIGRSVFAGAALLIPSVAYLSFRKKKSWKKIIVSTLIFGGLFGFIFEFIAEFNNAYHVVSVLFPYKVLDIMPIDNIIGHMMMTLLTIVFYVHFIGREKNHDVSKNVYHALLPAFGAIAFIIFAYFLMPDLIKFGHPYFTMGIAAISFPILLAIKQPKFIKNMLETAVYFFFLYFVIEILAVKLNYWVYPGTYVGWITVFNTTFPFEELFFWMMFYAATLVSFYERWVDIDK